MRRPALWISSLLALGLALVPPLAQTASADTGKSIVINLTQQQINVFQDDRLMLSTPTTTGRAELPTPIGSYSVWSKTTNFTFVSPWPPGSPFWYPNSPARYGLLFYTGGYFIHDASWRDSYGAGTNVWHRDANGDWLTGSHGCVNVPLAPMAWLYSWADVGTPIRVVG